VANEIGTERHIEKWSEGNTASERNRKNETEKEQQRNIARCSETGRMRNIEWQGEREISNTTTTKTCGADKKKKEKKSAGAVKNIKKERLREMCNTGTFHLIQQYKCEFVHMCIYIYMYI